MTDRLPHRRRIVDDKSGTPSLAALAQRFPFVVKRVLQPGQHVRGVQDPDDWFMLVREGALTIETRDAEGGVAVTSIAGPNATVYFETEPHVGSPSHVALAPTTVLLVHRTSFLLAFERTPGLVPAYLDAVQTQVQRQRDFARVLQTKDALPRVAYTLTLLSELVGSPCPLAGGVRLFISQERLSQCAGLARQTTNRELKRLEGAGLAFLHRKLVCIVDPRRVAKIADGNLEWEQRPAVVQCKWVDPQATLRCNV